MDQATRGDRWIQTYSGRRFWPLDPRADDVRIIDIAHALSMICRYQGHTRRFYSVAEHSLLLCQVVTAMQPDDIGQQLQALMHDAAEAYICDLSRPLKGTLYEYRQIERAIERAITERYHLIAVGKTPMIDELDTRILYDEASALMPVGIEPWHLPFAPGLGVEIQCYAPEAVETLFLDAFYLRTGRPDLAR